MIRIDIEHPVAIAPDSLVRLGQLLFSFICCLVRDFSALKQADRNVIDYGLRVLTAYAFYLGIYLSILISYYVG